MESTTSASSGWDVAVACDIRLQDVFRNNPELEGKYIDIDPVAIQEVLTSFGSERTGSVIFTAMHDISVPLEERGATFLLDDGPEVRRIGARVRVGGGISTALSSLADALGIDKSSGRLPSNKRDFTIAGEEIIKQFVTSNGKMLQGSKSVQESAVHELRHVFDFTDVKLAKKDKRYDQYTDIKAAAGVYLGLLVSNVGFQVGYETLIDSTDSLKRVAAGLIGTLACLPAARGAWRAYKNRRYHSSPMEKLAFATEEEASAMPQIISFKNIVN